MNGKWIKVAASATMALSLFSLQAPGEAKATEGDFELKVLHTNDTHAHVEAAPKRAALIKKLRDANPNNLLLDAGDVFSGTLYFNSYEGQADLELMNYMEYDAMTFGNHEFDLGSSENGHLALSEFVKGAKFPLVSANADFSQDEHLKDLQAGGYAADYENGKIYDGIVKEINGEKVGIFGLTTEETAAISSPGSVAFSNYIEEAKEAVESFEQQGVNKIIALTHIGYDDSAEYDNDKLLADAVDGIDIIVGGHTHKTLEEPVKADKDGDPTIIVQANEYSKFLGELNVTFDENGVILGYDGQLHDVAAVEEEDAGAAEILAKYKAEIDELKNQSIDVEAEVALDGSRGLWGVRAGETNLGNLMTDGMLATAKSIDPNVSIALQNGGGIRAGIDEGDITVGEVLTVMPFGNALAIMRVTGEELVQALEHSVRQFPAENGGFLHVSGLKFSFDGKAEAGNRVKEVLVETEDGYEALNPEDTYHVATNNFTAKGGDGYEMFGKAYEEGRVSEPGNIDYEMFIDYVSQWDSISPAVEGRIIATVPFTDVKVDSEFAPFIKDLYYRDLIKGTTATTYSPTRELTRSQATSILVRALGLDTEGKKANFKDLGNVEEETRAEIAAAQEAGIVKGLDGNFMPYEPVKRSQVALMLKRTYESLKDTTYEPVGNAPFKDIGGIDEEAQSAVAFLHQFGVAGGSDNGTKFRPAESATRQQAAKMMSNYVELIGTIKSTN